MANDDVLKINYDYLQIDWRSQGLTEAERKAEMHRCLHLSHKLTSIKRLIQKQTKVLRELGSRGGSSK